MNFGWIRIFVLGLLLLIGSQAAAHRRDTVSKVTTGIIEEPSDPTAEARTQRLYDSLETKAGRNRISKLLYELLVTEKQDLSSSPTGAVVDQGSLYEPYKGRVISHVAIDRIPIFDTAGSWFERAGNAIHVQTRERVIRRDLLFEEGDTLDPQELVRNLQLLRSRRYISDLNIRVMPDLADTDRVVLVVRIRDSWTIAPDGSWRGDGETMVGLSDENFLGWGNRFDVETNFDRRDFSYGGNVVKYEMPNLLGTFFKGEVGGGRKFDESIFRAAIEKELIQPTDYLFGSSYERAKRVFDERDPDNVIYERIKVTDIWGGYSHLIPSIRSSIYLIPHFSRVRFNERPEVNPILNPAYHERDELLVSLGMYREKFLTTNMIYGYGTHEYVGTGYGAELVGGYHWGEFYNGCYFGVGLKGGDFVSFGFIHGDLSLGTYINPRNGAWHRSIGQINLRWFSNLLSARRFNVRQFATLNYTQGWNRLMGANEGLDFEQDVTIRNLDDVDEGISRLCLNTETVLFTPYQPLGFRITLFGYADFGLLGSNFNPFRNSFYSSVGLGIRVKNERLIFSAFELQLGIAFGKRGLMTDNWFHFSSQRNLNEFRYRPTYPKPAEFD